MKLIAASPALVLAVAMVASCAGAPTARNAPVASAVVPSAQHISCRELLVPASNQLTRVCGSEEQWERYEKRMAEASQSLVLRLQGSPFGNGY
jgi:hypothetical protein